MLITAAQTLLDKPCERMTVELLRENREERAKQAIGGLLRTVQRLVQIKMEGDELVGTKKFATRVQGGKRLDVHQR